METVFISLFLGVICGIIAAVIAANHGRSAIGWFFIGFFLGLVGIILAAVLPSLKVDRDRYSRQHRFNRRISEEVGAERRRNRAFQLHAQRRLDTHDGALDVDTRSAPADSLAAEGDGQWSLPPPMPGASTDPPPPPPLRKWYYEQQGQSRGPATESEIARMLREGALAPETLVWCESLEDWTPARRLAAFQSHISP
jgi:uncharacterized membrane protein YeaQ/YmgE (transglycosylase-associated protein family)